MARESKFQRDLIRKLRVMFPDCYIEKGDSGYQQGICDLTIFWGPCWARLEVKASADSRERPNQAYFVELFNNMSFAAFIHPDNEQEVLDALQRSFQARWDARIS